MISVVFVPVVDSLVTLGVEAQRPEACGECTGHTAGIGDHGSTAEGKSGWYMRRTTAPGAQSDKAARGQRPSSRKQLLPHLQAEETRATRGKHIKSRRIRVIQTYVKLQVKAI